MKKKINTTCVTDSDVQQGLIEAAQLAQFANTLKKDPSFNALDHCPKCHLRFDVLNSIEMHHYYDQILGIWVTRWTTTDYEYCGICEITGKQAVDIFETPRYIQDIEIWKTKRLKRNQQPNRTKKQIERK